MRREDGSLSPAARSAVHYGRWAVLGLGAIGLAWLAGTAIAQLRPPSDPLAIPEKGIEVPVQISVEEQLRRAAVAHRGPIPRR
ncbi:MAG: hypothetical protein R3B96_19445 [Pirellulaceae bacterium]